MPLNIGDYLRDTQRLSAEEHGAYLLLIMEYWVHGGPLPDDEKALKNLTKMTPHKWKKIRPRIAEFFEVKDGFWHHKRIDKELRQARKLKEKRRAQTAKATEARRVKRPPDDNVTSDATSTPKPKPTPSKESSSLRSEDSSDAPAAQVARAREPEAAGRIVARFLALRARHWPRQEPCLTPRLTLETQAQQLLAADYPEGLVIEHLEAEMPRVAQNGRSPPGSLKFFANSLNDALVRHREGMGAVNGAGAGKPAESKAERDRRLIERVRKNRKAADGERAAGDRTGD
jgi:uncharacterized protein YdaU (DUF1376 family)